VSLKGESYEKRAAKRQKAKRIAQRRFEEERMAALESEAMAAANGPKPDDGLTSDTKSAIDVRQLKISTFGMLKTKR
jgi:hypothetical protein